MNKAELIRAISDHSGTTRLMAERMLNAFTATVVSECSKGHEVKIEWALARSLHPLLISVPAAILRQGQRL